MQNKLDPRWQETADALAIPLEDLLTVASYETGGTMDPLQRGPTTQWGQHAGLIQFGEPQAKKYGVDFTNAQTAMDSQLGADGAIVNYMLDHGFVPNQHSGMDIYSTINAGGPNLYNRSDANNGGAAGTVADKWNYQMGGHRQNAAQMMGGTYNPPASSRSKRRMAKDGSNMMQQQKQPQGLLGRLTNRSESTGLNLMESFAAGLDPLIMPSMRGGDAIRERGDKRVEQGDKNRTIDFLRANGRNDLAQMVSEGMITPKQAAAQMLTPKADNRTAGMQNYEYLVSNGVTPEEAMQRSFGKGGTNITLKTGESGMYGKPPEGSVWQFNEDGTHKMEDAGNGNMRPMVTPLRGTAGETRAGDQDTLEQKKLVASESAQDSINLIDSILTSEFLPSVTGNIQGQIPFQLRQGSADLAVKIDQLQGQAFLRAFESLKGGGQITEREGIAATKAIARLDRKQGTEEYKKSLYELKAIMDRGRRRALGEEIADDYSPQTISSENQNFTDEAQALIDKYGG